MALTMQMSPKFRCLEPTYNQESMVAAYWEAEPTDAYASWLAQVVRISELRVSTRPCLNEYSNEGRQLISTLGSPHA